MNDSSCSSANSSRMLSAPALGLVWFGASVSLAEILAGTLFAPLGLEKGIAAILIGHLIGCALFALVAFVSARTGKSAMDAVKISFGRFGSIIFSAANVVQLVGWTAIMVAAGASAANFLVPQLGIQVWALAIGGLIVLWIAIGLRNMSRLQSIASIALFFLTIVVSFVVFGSGSPAAASGGEGLSFGAAVEMAVAMPLSWLPVVGDYTRSAKRPLAGAMASTVAYFFGSCWMFAIGLGASLFAASEEVSALMQAAGLGFAGLLVVIFSTVTTTFLDAESAGMSMTSVLGRLDARVCGIAAAVIGTALAIFAPVGDYVDFLYFIGSIFAPMAAILLVDYFILHESAASKGFDALNAVIWVLGFVLYRFSIGWDFILGNTLPVIALVAAASFAAHLIRRRVRSVLHEENGAATPARTD